MPAPSESTTATRPPNPAAAASAAATVPESRPDRCTETIPLAPSSSSRVYVARNSSGGSPEVVTSRPSRIARRITSPPMSSPSRCSTPSISTGIPSTVKQPCAARSGSGKAEVESVTTTTVTPSQYLIRRLGILHHERRPLLAGRHHAVVDLALKRDRGRPRTRPTSRNSRRSRTRVPSCSSTRQPDLDARLDRAADRHRRTGLGGVTERRVQVRGGLFGHGALLGRFGRSRRLSRARGRRVLSEPPPPEPHAASIASMSTPTSGPIRPANRLTRDVCMFMPI